MRNIEEASTAVSVLAVLEGGPASLSEASRVLTVSAFAQKIKIPHYGGYEHFERTSELEKNASSHVVFRWTMRTEVAE
jgi:uncharacterized protein (UPF0548 family)